MKARGFAQLIAIGLLTVTNNAVTEEDLSGTYLSIQETTSVTKMPVLADVVARTRAVSVQELSHENGWLRGSGKLCDIRIHTTSTMVKTTLPDSFRRAIPPVRTNAKVTRAGGTLAFNQPEQTLVLGAKLSDKANEPLPRDPNDPRVLDQDKDGHPGVTVKVSGIASGEIYVAQRSTSRLNGHATPDGFHGNIQFTNDQEVLGATRSVLERNPRARPDPKRSWFHLKRLKGPITCKEAKRIASSL